MVSETDLWTCCIFLHLDRLNLDEQLHTYIHIRVYIYKHIIIHIYIYNINILYMVFPRFYFPCGIPRKSQHYDQAMLSPRCWSSIRSGAVRSSPSRCGKEMVLEQPWLSIFLDKLSIYLSIYLSIFLYTYLSIYLIGMMYIYIYIYTPIYMGMGDVDFWCWKLKVLELQFEQAGCGSMKRCVLFATQADCNFYLPGFWCILYLSFI